MSVWVLPGLWPFLIAAGLLLSLLIIEIALLAAGLSGMAGADGADVPDAADLGPEIAGLSSHDLPGDPALLAALPAGADAGFGPGGPSAAPPADVTAAAAGVPAVLGIGKLPLMLWLALFLAGFAGGGMALQAGSQAAFGWMLPALPAMAIALVPGLAMARGLAGRIARMVPRDETSAISERSLGRRRGVVTVGTARRASPAQVRITDHHGNLHYVMAEPLAETDEIEQGAEVAVLRLRDGALRLVRIG